MRLLRRQPGPVDLVDETWLRLALLRPELYPEGSLARANAEAINEGIREGFATVLCSPEHDAHPR